MAYYALNLFDLKDPEGYREYIRRARPVNENSLGSEVLAFGRLTDRVPQQFPGSTLGGAQRWLLLVKFKEFTGPKQMYDNPEYAKVSHLRADSTKNYTWAYYEDADILTQE
jgi:uncharacterized protein (DUF1330 family)